MRTILLFLLGLNFGLASAQTPPTPKPCTSEAHRQFDFWLGRWQVSANGNPAGVNEIKRVHGGCVLYENWVSANGQFTGYSLNLYDAARGVWHQSWADSSGTLLLLDGGLKEGSMVLQGQRPGTNGKTVHQRISWTPNEDGSVRQHWQTSADGENWQTAFDGLYRKSE